MEGLEVSEVQLSALSSIWSKFRIDAEYFSRRFLQNEASLASGKFTSKSLKKVTTKIDVGHVGSMVHAYCDEGVPLVLTQNVREFFVDYSQCIHITKEFHQELRKSQVFPGDCLVARSGSIGNAAFVLDSDPQPLNSADIIIIRPDSSHVTNGYLAGFLNSRPGALQIERLTSGGLQGHINLRSIEHLRIPSLSPEVQTAIDCLVRKGMKKLKRLKNLSSLRRMFLFVRSALRTGILPIL